MCRELKHVFQVVVCELVEVLTRKWLYYSCIFKFWEIVFILICPLFLIIPILFVGNKILLFIIWQYMLPVRHKLKILICKPIPLAISFRDVPCCSNLAVLQWPLPAGV